METKNLLFGILALIILSACSKSTEDEFDAVNGDVSKKYITRLQINDSNTGETTVYIVNYGDADVVTSITDGSNTAFLNYGNSGGGLNTVTDNDETFDIDELYQAPYDAFEKGDVLEYDSRGNPKKIEVYKDGYGSEILIGTINYEPTPNAFFYTLKAAGAIEVMDRVDLDLGIGNPLIIKARKLFPNNNIKSMIFRDLAGITRYEVQINYNYNQYDYPTTATISTYSQDESNSYSVIYTYR